MTVSTTAPAAGVVAKASSVLSDVAPFVPEVAAVASAIPGAAPYAAAAVAIFNAVTSGVALIQAEQGKSLEQAILDILAHLTPGQPNSPVLS